MKKFYRKNTVHPTSDHLSFLPAAIFTLTVALSQQDKEVLAYLISCSSGSSGNFSGDFSGNRRTTHKSTTPNSAPATTSKKGGTGGVGGGGSGSADQVLSCNFSGNRKTTHKSTTPILASDISSSGAKSNAAVNSGANGGADHVPSFNCYCFSCYMSYWVKWDSSPNRQLIHEILDAYEDGLQSKKEKSKKERKNKKKISSTTPTSCELKKSSSESNLTKNGSAQPDPVEELSGSRDSGGDGDIEEENGGVEEVADKSSVRKFVSFLGERIWGVWT